MKKLSNRAPKLTKKARKLLKGGNEMVKRSMECKKVDDYHGKTPVYANIKQKPHEPDNFVKVQCGVPFVRPELHGI